MVWNLWYKYFILYSRCVHERSIASLYQYSKNIEIQGGETDETERWPELFWFLCFQIDTDGLCQQINNHGWNFLLSWTTTTKSPDMQNFHRKFMAVVSKQSVTYWIGHPQYLCSGLDTWSRDLNLNFFHCKYFLYTRLLEKENLYFKFHPFLRWSIYFHRNFQFPLCDTSQWKSIFSSSNDDINFRELQHFAENRSLAGVIMILKCSFPFLFSDAHAVGDI